MTELDSGVLLSRVAGGDDQALSELLVGHLPALEAYIRLRLGAAIRAKESITDVVQSVCVEVLRDAPDFEYRGEAQFRAWLFQHALHKIANKGNFYGRQRRDVAREVPLAAGGDASEAGAMRVSQVYATICTPSRVARGREAVEFFERAFAELPDDYREAISLQRIVGLSHTEIAERMGRSEGAVRNLVYRGLARLSAALADLEAADDLPT